MQWGYYTARYNYRLMLSMVPFTSSSVPTGASARQKLERFHLCFDSFFEGTRSGLRWIFGWELSRITHSEDTGKGWMGLGFEVQFTFLGGEWGLWYIGVLDMVLEVIINGCDLDEIFL